MAQRRQQPGPGELVGERAAGVRRQRAQLHVATGSQLHPAVAELARQPRQHPHLPCADQPPGQPDPRQVPVGRLGQAQHPRAPVGRGAVGGAIGGGAGRGHARILRLRPAARL